eukprot:4480335-Pyramimonas_sp.AAC.1
MGGPGGCSPRKTTTTAALSLAPFFLAVRTTFSAIFCGSRVFRVLRVTPRTTRSGVSTSHTPAPGNPAAESESSASAAKVK